MILLTLIIHFSFYASSSNIRIQEEEFLPFTRQFKVIKTRRHCYNTNTNTNHICPRLFHNKECPPTGLSKSYSRKRIFQTMVMKFALLQMMMLDDVKAAQQEQQQQTHLESFCDNGAILEETAIPGAYQQICMNIPTRSILLKSTGDEILIYQSANGSSSLSGRTGVVLWNSGLLLTRLLDLMAQQDTTKSLFMGKTVLELGCGTALASIAIGKLGASFVIATDGNEEVVSLGKFNLDSNRIKGEAKLLKWGSLDTVDFYDTADIIIGSDLTYNSGSWRILADTFDTVLKRGGIAVYLTLGHSGFNVSSEMGGFLTIIESQTTLQVMRQESESFEKMLVASLDSNEKKIIHGTGGVRVVILQKK